MAKTKRIEMELYENWTIGISFDGDTFHNIHLALGIEAGFDRLVEILSEQYEIGVHKHHGHLDTLFTVKKQAALRKQ